MYMYIYIYTHTYIHSYTYISSYTLLDAGRGQRRAAVRAQLTPRTPRVRRHNNIKLDVIRVYIYIYICIHITSKKIILLFVHSFIHGAAIGTRPVRRRQRVSLAREIRNLPQRQTGPLARPKDQSQPQSEQPLSTSRKHEENSLVLIIHMIEIICIINVICHVLLYTSLIIVLIIVKQ